jgi:hypothetical protein
MTDATIRHLREERDLDVPPAHEPLLEAYWDKMRRLRAQVDEDLLGTADVAVTWSATREDR